jgi:carbonic anhydrase/acetyltransferase-like protein (isoleucine patch superfamily)
VLVVNDGLWRLLYVVDAPFRRLGRLVSHARLITRWGQRAAAWSLDVTVTCNDPGAVSLGNHGVIGAGLEIVIADGYPETHRRGRVILESGVELAGQSTLMAKGGVIEVGERTYIGPHCHLGAYGAGIRIGADVLIASHCAMVDTQHGFSDPSVLIKYQPFTSRGIVVEEGAWLGAGVRVMDGVTIGRGAVVGAGAVVTHDIPAYAIAVGVPARVKGYRDAGGD